MTSPLTNRDKMGLFRIFKTNQNATFISKKSGLCHRTVLKVIKNERFKERLAMIQTAALEIVDMNQAEMLATNIVELCNIEDMIKDSLLANPDKEFTVTDLDKIIRLKMHLLGLPDLSVETHNTTIEVVQVARSDVIDAEFEDQKQNTELSAVSI